MILDILAVFSCVKESLQTATACKKCLASLACCVTDSCSFCECRCWICMPCIYFSSEVAQICFDFLLQSPLPLVLSSRGCSNPRLLSSLSPSSMIIDALLSSATLPTWALQLARTVMGRGCTSRLIASKGVLLNFHHGYGNNSDSSLNNTSSDQDIFPACTSTTTTTCLMGDGFSPQALMTMTEPLWWIFSRGGKRQCHI